MDPEDWTCRKCVVIIAGDDKGGPGCLIVGATPERLPGGPSHHDENHYTFFDVVRSSGSTKRDAHMKPITAAETATY